MKPRGGTWLADSTLTGCLHAYCWYRLTSSGLAFSFLALETSNMSSTKMNFDLPSRYKINVCECCNEPRPLWVCPPQKKNKPQVYSSGNLRQDMQSFDENKHPSEKRLSSSGSSLGTHEDLASWGAANRSSTKMASAQSHSLGSASELGEAEGIRMSSATVFDSLVVDERGGGGGGGGGLLKPELPAKKPLAHSASVPPLMERHSSKLPPPPDMEDIE